MGLEASAKRVRREERLDWPVVKLPPSCVCLFPYGVSLFPNVYIALIAYICRYKKIVLEFGDEVLIQKES